MPDRIISIFGSYDFFGKSIPGVVLFLGFVPLFPAYIDWYPNTTNSAANIAAILIILLIIGVILGQGVHTLAIVMERWVAWCGDRVSGVSNLIRDLWGSFSLGSVVPREYRERIPKQPSSTLDLNWNKNLPSFVTSIISEIKRLQKVTLTNWANGTRQWVWMRYWGTNDTFKNHRVLFEEELRWYLSPYVYSRKAQDTHVVKQRFVDCIKTRHKLDSTDFTKADQIYSLVTSELAASDLNRASAMYARYSFCRGMWVVLLTIILSYLLLMLGWAQPLSEFSIPLYFPSYSSVLGLSPRLFDIIPVQSRTQVMLLLCAFLTFFFFVFMVGAGKYKRHYIEYLFAEYYILHNRS